MIDDHTTPVAKVLTGNNTTIYGAVFADLQRDGPVVIDSPKACTASSMTPGSGPVVEIGPFGPDKGKGGKFLLLPPGHRGNVPSGYRRG
jgi:hypothetical protein